MTPQQPPPESFDIEGWQRLAQFGMAVLGFLGALWVWVARIWTPYKARRDAADAEKMRTLMRATFAPELAALAAVCVSADECAERWERVTDHLEDFDAGLRAMTILGLENRMLSNDAIRVVRLVTNTPETAEEAKDRARRDEEWHAQHARLVAELDHREEARARERERQDREERRSAFAPRRAPPRPGGRRPDDPPGQRGSEI